LAEDHACLRDVGATRQEAEADVAALCSEVGQLKKAADAAERLAEEAQKQLAAEVEQLKASSEEVKAKETEQERAIVALKAWTGALDSRVFSSLPPLFDEVREKRLVLLWRGSRDGFGVEDFHGRCDGHANTLMLVLDTCGNVFGGFTPLEWESRKWHREGTRTTASNAMAASTRGSIVHAEKPTQHCGEEICIES
jgi:hypothetical protein